MAEVRRGASVKLLMMINLVSWLIMMKASSLDTKQDQDISTADAIANPNFTNTIHNIVVPTTEPPVTCEVARIKCALRRGCGRALQSYMLDCADLMDSRIEYCDEFCEASLIALTSSEEGESLMNCRCADAFCEEKKSRVEVCRDRVLRAKETGAVVSCSVAHLICSADTSCFTALEFYDILCRRMFMGKSCSFRCNNSIAILSRQEKAAKLESCLCDGTESFDCFGIKKNMARLCFPIRDEREREEEENINRISDESGDKSSRSNSTSDAAPREFRITTQFSSSILTLLGLVASAVVR